MYATALKALILGALLLSSASQAQAQSNASPCPLTAPAHNGVALTFPDGGVGWFGQEGGERIARNVGEFDLNGTNFTLKTSATWGPRAYLGQSFKWEITAVDDAERAVRITIWSSCDPGDVSAGFIMARYKVSGAVNVEESSNSRVKDEPKD